MSSFFGETVSGYSFKVLNEREVRAGAGILFFATLSIFLYTWFNDSILPAKLMIIGFFIDFAIRVINPRYAPSLVLGRLAVRSQTPEYTEAAPKQFAWWLGFGLACIMMVTLVLSSSMSPLNLFICALCIWMLYMETSFGFCLGCWLYQKLPGKRPQLCAGDSCVVKQIQPIQQVSTGQVVSVLGTVIALVIIGQFYAGTNLSHAEHMQKAQLDNNTNHARRAVAEPVAQTPPGNSSCEVPAFAKAMGHEEKWKQHHGCK